MYMKIICRKGQKSAREDFERGGLERQGGGENNGLSSADKVTRVGRTQVQDPAAATAYRSTAWWGREFSQVR